MSVLVAVVVALSLVCAFNTLVCFGVIARLRALAAAGPRQGGPFGGPAAGHRIGAFATTAVDGGPLTTADLDAPTAVLFLSPDCAPCRDARAALVARGPIVGRTVVFVYGDRVDPAAAEFAAGLPDDVRTAFVGDEDPVTKAFGGIHLYPTLLRVERAEVTLVGHDVDAVALDLI